MEAGSHRVNGKPYLYVRFAKSPKKKPGGTPSLVPPGDTAHSGEPRAMSTNVFARSRAVTLVASTVCRVADPQLVLHVVHARDVLDALLGEPLLPAIVDGAR
jgi:hypothetical protein